MAVWAIRARCSAGEGVVFGISPLLPRLEQAAQGDLEVTLRLIALAEQWMYLELSTSLILVYLASQKTPEGERLADGSEDCGDGRVRPTPRRRDRGKRDCFVLL